MASADRLLKLLLRLYGYSGLLALGAVIMPRPWLTGAVEAVEPGTTVTFLVEYLARSLSAFYFLLGALLLICARDVRRYAPVIRLLSGCCIALPAMVLAVVLLAPGPRSPWAWLLVADAVVILAFGVLALSLQRRL